MNLVENLEYTITIPIIKTTEIFSKQTNHPLIHKLKVTYNGKDNEDNYIFIFKNNIYSYLKEDIDYDIYNYLLDTCAMIKELNNEFYIHIAKNKFILT
jgi:hypothetical protein